MPVYPGNDLATLLRNNTQVFLWNNETITAGGADAVSLSQAFQLERVNRSFYPWGLSFEVWFSGAPGAFEVDIMVANQDLGIGQSHYNQIGTITTVNSSNVGRYDMATNIWPKYVAAYLKTLSNAVNITLQVAH